MKQKKELRLVAVKLPLDLFNEIKAYNEKNLTSTTKVIIKSIQDFLLSRADK